MPPKVSTSLTLSAATTPALQRAWSLANRTNDEELLRWVRLAIGVQTGTGHRIGSRRMTATEVREHRISCWGRVWAHLAGHRVRGLNERPAETVGTTDKRLFGLDGADEPVPWIAVRLLLPDGSELAPPLDQATVVGRGEGLRRRRLLRTAGVSVLTRFAVDLGPGASIETSWGWLGSGDAVATKRTSLPRGARPIRRAVSTAIADVEREVRRVVRPSRRRHLDNQADAFAVYLLRNGHGALNGRGWQRVAEAFFGFPCPTIDGERAPEVGVVRDLEEAARHALLTWRLAYPGT